MLPERNAAASTPTSHDSASETHGSHPTLTLGQQWAASSRALFATMDLNPERRRHLEAVASFAERTGCAAVTDYEIDLWGYGAINPMFADEDGHWFAVLQALIEPTGLEYQDLRTRYLQAVENGDDDVEELSWLVDDDDPHDREICQLEFVGPSFAMRAMMAGPWGREIADALFPTFRRAAVKSGLADAMGIAEIIAPDGQIPTAEEAKAAAFRGPLGGVL